MKKRLNQLFTWSLFPYVLILLISFPIIIGLSFVINLWKNESSVEGIVIESFGMIFDVIILGLFFTIINNIRERRLETKRYKEEIDDYRNWESDEGSRRISGVIRRLNKKGESESLNLVNYYLQEADLKQLNLQYANLLNANLEGAWLIGSNLKHANLEDANLEGSWLGNAILQHANLSGAKLSGAGFNGTNLKGATVSLYQLKEVASLQGAIMPDGTRFDSGWAVMIKNSKDPINLHSNDKNGTSNVPTIAYH